MSDETDDLKVIEFGRAVADRAEKVAEKTLSGSGRIHPKMSLQDCKHLARLSARKKKSDRPMTEAAIRRRQRLQFLPTRKADEDQQQALFHLMLLVDGGYSRCCNCGQSEINDKFDREASGEIGDWLARGPFQDKDQRTREPTSVLHDYPTHEHEIAIPSRTATRGIQEAAADLIHVAQSAEMACPNCGETMRLQYDTEEMFDRLGYRRVAYHHGVSGHQRTSDPSRGGILGQQPEAPEK